MRKSRRKAREAALRALYNLDVTKGSLPQAIQDMHETSDYTADQAAYAEKLVEGVHREHKDLDERLAAVIKEYDYDRLAMVDRNVLRIAAFEIFHEPGIPPAVTIDEAIEIARKYSTAESGKFVNGVLGKLLEDSPKANWDPKTAPKEEFEEPPEEDEPMQVIEETLQADSEDAKRYARIAGWKLRSDD